MADSLQSQRASLRPGASSKLISRVVEVMESMSVKDSLLLYTGRYPTQLADHRWDNVGLVVDSAVEPSTNPDATGLKQLVLLTNDLTSAVVDEAIALRAAVVVSYHPFIFRGLKSITNADPQQRSLLRLARCGIAVYCPHTAVDAAPGGINDWLADSCLATNTPATMMAATEGQKQQQQQQRQHGENPPLREASRSVLKPVASALPSGFSATNTGYGRRVELEGPGVPLGTILRNLRHNLGFSFAAIALPQQFRQLDGVVLEQFCVGSLAVCAGSGSSVLEDCTDVPLLVTGELSHHEALHFVERGQVCVCVMHSTSERAFLSQRLQGQLREKLGENVEVVVSKADTEIFHVFNS